MTMKFDWKAILRFGFFGGIAALYFSMIGMVELFSGRDLIGDFLNLGHLLLYGGMIGAGLLVAGAHKESNLATKAIAGLIVGALASTLTILLIIVSQQIDVRQVFVNVNPNLVSIITLDKEGSSGLLIFLGVSALLGFLTALFTGLNPKARGPIGKAIVWTLITAVFSDLVIQIMENLSSRTIVKLFFDGKAIKPFGAVGLLVILILLFYLRDRRIERDANSETKAEPDAANRTRRQLIQFALLGALLLAAPWILGSFLSQVLFEIGRFVLLGLGLNIVVGYAGLLDLGYVAFFAFGAYSMGILTTITDLNAVNGALNFWTALPISVLVGVLFGALLGFPVLRMRGDYLAIVTLGFGEIIRILALSDWLAPIMGGAQGVLKIPNPVIFGVELGSPQTMYYLVLVGSLLAAFISIRLRDSRLGRQWMAMREDEDVAEAMGINLVQTKLLAFAIGAGFSSLGGAIFAARLSNIFPHSFNLLISVNALSLIIVGGLGSIPGVIVGAFVLVGMPELLREFQEYRLLMYGILLIVMMLVRPEGFVPADVFTRELHTDEELETIAAESKA